MPAKLSDLLEVTLRVRGRGGIELKHLASGTQARGIPLDCLLGLVMPVSSPRVDALCLARTGPRASALESLPPGLSRPLSFPVVLHHQILAQAFGR